ncbi:hypothetical protein [Mesorhizobium captivum]|uniref:hypothetical protein n=1 Tax=Mesorhizobium captivum TaxID=3072319 RepID=UPI002A23A26F|nr:hypothetical protein [Mesorhizobium sp. VK3C]MDX8449477.1 hypothetical protein [Mesorhizobium sp. VK3C]
MKRFFAIVCDSKLSGSIPIDSMAKDNTFSEAYGSSIASSNSSSVTPMMSKMLVHSSRPSAKNSLFVALLRRRSAKVAIAEHMAPKVSVIKLTAMDLSCPTSKCWSAHLDIKLARLRWTPFDMEDSAG